MTELLDKLMQEGKPVQITLDTAADDAEVAFELDSDTVPILGEVLEDMMLWISAIKIVTGAASTLEAFKVDGELVWSDETATPARGLDLSGELHESATPIGYNKASIKDKFGVNFIPVRNSFSLKNLAASTDISKITVWGVYTKRNM